MLGRRMASTPGRLVAVAAFATGITASVAGCASLLVSTDGLSGGAADDGAAAAIDGQGGDAAEAGRPGPGDDSGTTASLDAAGGDADAAAPFCASHPGHTFCDDFDDGTDLATKWMTNVQGRGVVGTDTTLARSAPRSFASFTPAGATLVSVAKVERSVGSSDKLRVAFDLNISAPPGPVGDSIATLNLGSDYLDLLWFDSGKLEITERIAGAPNVDHAASKMLPAGSWAHLQIESTPGHIVMTIDSDTVIDATTTHTFSGAVTIGIGLYSNDAYAIAFHYDNVLVDTAF